MINKRAITNPSVLNEAFHYAKPSSFSRGIRVDLNGATFLYISGTASIDEHGLTVHAGDFRAQTLRTYHNVKGLLAAEGATWRDVVKTTVYIKDIARHYDEFNLLRAAFLAAEGADAPYPASVGVQATLCREDLLIEMDALAILQSPRK